VGESLRLVGYEIRPHRRSFHLGEFVVVRSFIRRIGENQRVREGKFSLEGPDRRDDDEETMKTRDNNQIDRLHGRIEVEYN